MDMKLSKLVNASFFLLSLHNIDSHSTEWAIVKMILKIRVLRLYSTDWKSYSNNIYAPN